MTLLSQSKKKQERKTLYFCFSISILLCLQKSPAKEFPCWEKIKMIFAYLCFLFFWKQCFARFVCVVMRSSIAFLSLTIMKTVTLPILFSLLLLLLSHTFTSLLFTDFCFWPFKSLFFFSVLWVFHSLIYLFNLLVQLIRSSNSVFFIPIASHFFSSASHIFLKLKLQIVELYENGKV